MTKEAGEVQKRDYEAKAKQAEQAKAEAETVAESEATDEVTEPQAEPKKAKRSRVKEPVTAE